MNLSRIDPALKPVNAHLAILVCFLAYVGLAIFCFALKFIPGKPVHKVNKYNTNNDFFKIKARGGGCDDLPVKKLGTSVPLELHPQGGIVFLAHSGGPIPTEY